MNNQRTFAQQSAGGIIAGLHQELSLTPQAHYLPAAHVSSRVVKLRLRRLNPHWLDRVLSMQRQLTMFAGLPDTERVRVGWESGHTLTVEIPKPRNLWQPVTAQGLVNRRIVKTGPVATLGLDVDDRPVRIDMQEPALAHVFITGQTRSGKTNTQKLFAWNLVNNTAPAECQLLVLDVEKSGYNWQVFDGLRHLAHPVVTNLHDATAALGWLEAELDERTNAKRTTPRLFIFVDELKSLIDSNEQAARQLGRVAAVGGEFGMHLILATQYPQVKMLGNAADLKRNITTRLCGRVDDANAAANALGVKNSGAETLQGYGDFLLKSFDGLTRLTVAEMSDSLLSSAPAGSGSLDLAEYMPELELAVQSGHVPVSPADYAAMLANWPGHILGLDQIKTLTGGNTDRARFKQAQAVKLIDTLKALTNDGMIDLSTLGTQPYTPKRKRD